MSSFLIEPGPDEPISSVIRLSCRVYYLTGEVKSKAGIYKFCIVLAMLLASPKVPFAILSPFATGNCMKVFFGVASFSAIVPAKLMLKLFLTLNYPVFPEPLLLFKFTPPKFTESMRYKSVSYLVIKEKFLFISSG